jgi:hypothetical protein
MRSIGDALDVTGWAWIHHRPARRADGRWQTPVSGNSGRGFPDIVAVREPRILWLEIKAEGGKTSPEQDEWQERLTACGAEALVLTMPRDWHRFDGLIAPDPVQQTLTMNSTGAVPWYPITTGSTGAGSVPLTPVRST